MKKHESLRVQGVGQIATADVAFGDLTVLVGPQATGKSIFLQLLKLVLDTGNVHDRLRKHGIDWKREVPDFLDIYLGEGMRGVWRFKDPASAIAKDGKELVVEDMVKLRTRTPKQTVFYVPAQRVLTLANGWPRPFHSFAAEDPFAVKDFSESFRLLMEKELFRSDDIFPRANRLKEEYRKLLSAHVFGGARLQVDRHGAQKRLVLSQDGGENTIPFMAWSAGQREFVPLLMGLYWLLPAARIDRRDDIGTVILEEPEMGLHPFAVSVVMLLVLELLWRGYRVFISTHSPQVLDVLWALSVIQAKGAAPEALLEVFDVRKSKPMKAVAEAACGKTVRVYYFQRDGQVRDISTLDPGAEEASEAGWGGLSEFTGRVNDVVAKVAMGQWARKA